MKDVSSTAAIEMEIVQAVMQRLTMALVTKTVTNQTVTSTAAIVNLAIQTQIAHVSCSKTASVTRNVIIRHVTTTTTIVNVTQDAKNTNSGAVAILVTLIVIIPIVTIGKRVVLLAHLDAYMV